MNPKKKKGRGDCEKVSPSVNKQQEKRKPFIDECNTDQIFPLQLDDREAHSAPSDETAGDHSPCPMHYSQPMMFIELICQSVTRPHLHKKVQFLERA